MRYVDKNLASGAYGNLQAWAEVTADEVAREFEMGVDFDFAVLGESRRRILRMELVRRGYSVVGGQLIRMKSGRAVA